MRTLLACSGWPILESYATVERWGSRIRHAGCATEQHQADPPVPHEEARSGSDAVASSISEDLRYIGGDREDGTGADCIDGWISR